MNLRGNKLQNGFSLLEMAIVLAIVTALLGGLLPMLSGQAEVQHIRDTRKQMDDIRESLLGFATTNGRLPCPASTTSNGMESFCTSTTPAACGAEVVSTVPAHGRCKYPFNGFVPAVTLGITPISSQGYLLDGWNNPVRYAVTNVSSSNTFTFTAPGAIQTAVRSSGSFANLNSDLYVCSGSPNPSTPSLSVTSSPWCGTTAITLTSTAPAIIYSTGNNGSIGSGSADEIANASPYSNPVGSPNSYDDKVFVSHDQTPTFDDIVVWLSPNILINRMVTSGQLP